MCFERLLSPDWCTNIFAELLLLNYYVNLVNKTQTSSNVTTIINTVHIWLNYLYYITCKKIWTLYLKWSLNDSFLASFYHISDKFRTKFQNFWETFLLILFYSGAIIWHHFLINMLKGALQWSAYPQLTGGMYKSLWQPLQSGLCMLVLILATRKRWKTEWTLAGTKVTKVFNHPWKFQGDGGSRVIYFQRVQDHCLKETFRKSYLRFDKSKNR